MSNIVILEAIAGTWGNTIEYFLNDGWEIISERSSESQNTYVIKKRFSKILTVAERENIIYDALLYGESVKTCYGWILKMMGEMNQRKALIEFNLTKE